LGASGTTSSNFGGGGAYPGRDDNADCGAGGAYGSDGESGTNRTDSPVTAGGDAYGDAYLEDWFMGSGGGGGSPDTEWDGNSYSNYAGDGGNGGGIIAIFSGDSIQISGSVNTDGQPGDDAESGGGELGGGGGGAGGQIYLAAENIYISGDVTALAGIGGSSDSDSPSDYTLALGGDGGEGRILIDSDNIKGATDPEATEGSWPPK
jgi:hypothetical protein